MILEIWIYFSQPADRTCYRVLENLTTNATKLEKKTYSGYPHKKKLTVHTGILSICIRQAEMNLVQKVLAIVDKE